MRRAGLRAGLLSAALLAALTAALPRPAAAASKGDVLHQEIRDLTQRVDDLQTQQTRLEEKLIQAEPAVGGRDGSPGVRTKDDSLHDWSGFYAGANFGGGLANGIIEDKDCYDCAADSFSEGFRQGGLHAGYNMQFHRTVLGLETELNYGSQDHSGSLGGDDGGTIEATRSRIDWTGALLARAGIAAGDALFFTEAGPAFAHLRGSSVQENTPTPFGYRIDRRAPAVKAAIGVEFMVSIRVSVRAQYSVLQLVDEKAPQDPYICNAGGTCRTGFTNMQQAATLGADWHF